MAYPALCAEGCSLLRGGGGDKAVFDAEKFLYTKPPEDSITLQQMAG